MIRVHKMLTKADNFHDAQKYVSAFFEKSMIIHYDSVVINEDLSLAASDDEFWPEIETSTRHNRSILETYIAELKEEGVASLDDCTNLTVGYPSKLFHIIAHLLDGFIGIDSMFYSLPEDSHWLSESLQEQIESSPQKYWLVHTEGHFVSESKASVIHV